MDKKNSIKIYTTSNGAELSISAPSTKQTISATNNRAQYFAEQAMKYRDEAKMHRDNAKYYSEQNSDVTFEYINNVRIGLENKILLKQDIGDYALREEIPTSVGELENDFNYTKKEYVDMQIEKNKLPNQDGNIGKFLMADGEKGVWMDIMTIQMFDTKITDCILENEKAVGWALQGTYVNGAVYPDFYAKCLEEYNEATETETINGVTVKVNSNGHKFYDIADKTVIDEFYNSLGSAWFYGIDTENERIFLPRDKYFAVKGNVPVAGNGMTLGLTNGTNNFGLSNAYDTSNPLGGWIGSYGANVGTERAGNSLSTNMTIGVTFDPTKSGIEGQLTANEGKYLYICVGNTIVNEDQIDVSKVLSEAVLRSSLEQVQVVVETYKNGASWYRVWSDGWCEQGGIVITPSSGYVDIVFVKPYKDVNYTPIVSALQAEGSFTNWYAGTSYETPTGMRVAGQSAKADLYIAWQASGYIW